MDIQKVNTVLNRAIRILEHSEMEASAEMNESYVGYGGTEAPDHSPEGDPIEGGDGGVDNMETAEEQFYSYLMDVATTVAAQAKITDDKAVSFIEQFADEMANADEIAPMPDPETGTAEEFSGWAAAAKTAGFCRRVCDYAAIQMGKNPGTATVGD